MLTKITSKLNKDSNLKELVTGSFITFVLKITGMVLGYLVIYLIAQKNGAEGIGYYSLINRILMMLSLIAAFGTNTSILRYVGQFNTTDERYSLPSLFKRALVIALPIAIFLGIVLFFFAETISTKLFRNPEYAEAIEFISYLLPIYTLDLIAIEFNRGLKKVKISEFNRSIIKPLIIFSSILILWNEKIPNIYIIYLFGVAILVSMLISITAVAFELFTLSRIEKRKSSVGYSELIKVSSPMMITALVSILMGSLSIFFLEYYVSTDDVGVFSVVLRISEVILIILIVINTIAAPKFSELFWSKKMEDLQRLLHQSAKILFIISMFMAIVISLLSYWILDFFGSEFVQGQTALFILIAGQLFNVVTGSVGLMLNMSGNQHVLRNTALVAVVIQIILAILIIPSLGIVGAAITTATTTIIWNILNLIYVKKKLNLRTYYLPFKH